MLLPQVSSHGAYLIPSARCDGAESADIIAQGERLAGSEAARESWHETLLSAEAVAAWETWISLLQTGGSEEEGGAGGQGWSPGV